ncbi:irregular chiasm C-roughest protein-like [Macrobrachium rosenbergii]|uniref:irregular chiasm C-roughest protein-like n=1 Tax=Macrobrachium rosenbergii TaxID=79674 RepID=UPI0034D72650
MTMTMESAHRITRRRHSPEARWLLIRGWLLAWTTVIAAEQRFASQPSPQTALIGSTVVLPCRIIGRVGEVQWTRDDFGLGNERELYAFQRYQMIGSDEEGDFSLRISPVTLEDDSHFQCQVTGWRNVPGVRSQSAKLTVYAPPESPTIAPGPLVTTTAGVGVQLECTSNLGKPAAELQWLDGSGHVVKEGVQYTTVKAEDGHRYNATSTLSFLAGSEHHESLFTCFASSPALNEPASAQVRLEVIYPPEITITTDLTGYREGQTATLTCSARANPNVLTYRWYRNGKQVTANNATQLIIENVTKSSASEDISCQVSNEIGASRKSIRLPIHYGPIFAESPVDQYADIGEEVSLVCEVDSSPDPTILWISQKTQGVVGKGPKLDLNVTENTIGRYLCLAKVEDFPEISALVGAFTKVPPRVSCAQEQWSKMGDDAKLECTIGGTSAQSLRVIWTRHGKEINLESERYKVEQWVTRDGIRHILSIREAQDEDFGSYNFSAHNDYGSDFFEMVLRQTRKLPFVIMVGGVTGGIVFVVVVLTVVVICARKSATSQKEAKKLVLPEKTVSFQMNDQSSTSTDSDLKVESSQKKGPSMIGRKNGAVESWRNEANRVMETAYLTSSKPPYICPDTYTAVPIRTNGHLRRKSESYCFSNYADHAVLMDHQQPQRVSPPAGEFMRNGNNGMRKSLGAGLGSRGLRSSNDLVTASQYTLYPGYDDYGVREPAEENNRFSHAYGDGGVSNPNFKASCGSLPLSFHVNSRTSVAKGHPPTGRPRLGTQVLPNHYYAPGTQLLDGSLATHV